MPSLGANVTLSSWMFGVAFLYHARSVPATEQCSEFGLSRKVLEACSSISGICNAFEVTVTFSACFERISRIAFHKFLLLIAIMMGF